jgi:peptidyl-prolyl cis-trans isomerase SurA
MTSLLRKILVAASLAVLMVATPLIPAAGAAGAGGGEIKYVVNGVPITSYDLQRRAAFIKLQRSKQSASESLIEQVLHVTEALRLNIRVTDQQVDAAYANFAKNNKMPVAQLDAVLDKSGVTKEHFKGFIRAQMSWQQALAARARGGAGPGGRLTEQQAVRKMLERGGNKPSATEYMLQQVIFVVPAKDKGSLGRRKNEAEAMRARFTSCDTTRQFAKGLVDVTVRDLGRVLAPELPSEWAESIKAARPGSATPVKQTDRGIEFIGICSAREVSDDRAAQMVLNSEQSTAAKNTDMEALNKSYTEELRKRAQIVER